MPTLLTKREAAALVGWHPEHLMRQARAGRFPKPVKLGPTPQHAVRFVAEKVEQRLHERIEERDRQAPEVGVTEGAT